MSDDVDNRVQTVLADVFGLDAAGVGPDTSTDTVEAWDSLQQLTVVLSIEEEFGIHLTDDDAVAAVSFPLITAIVRERLGIPEPG
jgi:acyl carrier protein